MLTPARRVKVFTLLFEQVVFEIFFARTHGGGWIFYERNNEGER